MFLVLALLFLCGDLTLATTLNRCSSISCVVSAAALVERLNVKIDPCEDFYEYACGAFADEVYTPDEKTSVDTTTLMTDKLIEVLLTLFRVPLAAQDLEIHKIVKKLFASCMMNDKINERGVAPMKEILTFIGGWPLIEGDGWNESDWEWETSILKLRELIAKRMNNIFAKEKQPKEEEASQNFGANDEFLRVESSLKNFMKKIATILGAPDTPTPENDINSLIDFEKSLGDFTKKIQIFKKKGKSNEKLQRAHKRVVWMELFAPNILADPSRVYDIVPLDFNKLYLDFLEQTPKRTLANYVGWRVVQASIFFLNEDIRQALLEFEKSAYGKEDFEQRWKLCVAVTSERAPVATGSLYISEYFSEEDKKAAVEMVDLIADEYKSTINASTWMDENVKNLALTTAEKMLKFIGYHDNLRTIQAENYYNELEQWPAEKFLESGLSLIIFNADREFARRHLKRSLKVPDWTKYSKPATVNAFYNSKDNSIQFPAAILQRPNFDRRRPASMNFGAIGSIIGHEITHSFDYLTSASTLWSEESKRAYDERVKCLTSQYSSLRVPEVENFFQLSEFRLNGNVTQKEDIADCGGVKLALNAFKKSQARQGSTRAHPVGFEDFTQEKLFYLSFAQTFCSVERPEKMKSRVESDVHSLNRFRVLGSLRNLPEFSETWNCPAESFMNPSNKCAVW